MTGRVALAASMFVLLLMVSFLMAHGGHSWAAVFCAFGSGCNFINLFWLMRKEPV